MEKKCAEKYSIDWNRIEGPAFGKTKQKGHIRYDMYAHVFIMKISYWWFVSHIYSWDVENHVFFSFKCIFSRLYFIIFWSVMAD